MIQLWSQVLQNSSRIITEKTIGNDYSFFFQIWGKLFFIELYNILTIKTRTKTKSLFSRTFTLIDFSSEIPSRIKVRGDATLPQTSKSKQRGFYDLTRARTQESGSITRVEEFGLSSVSEEVNVSDDAERPTSASPDSGKANSSRTLHSNLKRKTVSSDDILENSRTKLQPPVSFSMDKLCSDVENDETRTSPTTTAPEAGCETSRDHGGKGGLIKRRMLGSIRGLMASTHLLQTYEIEEVLCAHSKSCYFFPVAC